MLKPLDDGSQETEKEIVGNLGQRPIFKTKNVIDFPFSHCHIIFVLFLLDGSHAIHTKF